MEIKKPNWRLKGVFAISYWSRMPSLRQCPFMMLCTAPTAGIPTSGNGTNRKCHQRPATSASERLADIP